MDESPVKVEAEGHDTITIDLLGHEVTIPASPDDWDLNVGRAFADGDSVRIVELLVGKKKFAEIEKAHRAANAGRFVMGDLKPFADKLAETYGFDTAGE